MAISLPMRISGGPVVGVFSNDARNQPLKPMLSNEFAKSQWKTKNLEERSLGVIFDATSVTILMKKPLQSTPGKISFLFRCVCNTDLSHFGSVVSRF